MQNNLKDTISFDFVKANVHSVEFKGLHYTKKDYVKQSLNGLFKVDNFTQLLNECHKASTILKSLGVFKEVAVEIDTSNASDISYIVRFRCKELPLVVGQIGTEVESNGMGSAKAELEIPNLFGRGEKLIFGATKSFQKQDNLCFKICKPFLHTNFSAFKPEISAGLFRKYIPYCVSWFDLGKYGIFSNFTFQTEIPFLIKHTIEWEAFIKEIIWERRPPTNFYHENGPTQVSTLRYSFLLDRRDSRILPTSGYSFRGIFDISSNHFSNYLIFEASKPIYKDFVGQITGKIGYISNCSSNQKSCPIPIDKLFYFGGHQTLRGFQYGGAGPRINGVTLGLKNFWSLGFHLWSPIPFQSRFPHIQDLVKTHFFFNCGGCTYINTIRSAFGVGVALNLSNICRLELNYTLPLRNCMYDRLQRGFKFYIGNDFI